MHARPTGVDMAHWGPGVEHWAAGEKYYAVMVDDATNGTLPMFLTVALEEIARFDDLDYRSHQILPRPTTLVRCDEHGVAIDADTSTPAVELLTEFEFPAGTTAADAMVAAGYEIGDGSDV